MKQFTYKEFDTITGIVFTNLCCDMLNMIEIEGLKTEISKMESYLNEHYFEDDE